MLSTKTLLASSLFASAALAHYTLEYPTSRGFDHEKEIDFCGGYNTAMAERQSAPLNGAPIWIDSGHVKATVDAYISTKPDPKTWDDFNTTANGTSSIMTATPFFQVAEGVACWNIDFGSLPYNLTDGSQITLQIRYNGGDSPLYQCTDLVLLSNYTVPSNWTCSQDAAAACAATGSGANPSATSSASGSASSAASTAQSSATRTVTSAGAFAIVAAAALAAIM